MDETQFRAELLKLAGMLGWLCYFTYRSKRSPKGYPDLTLCRERVIFAELKSDTGRHRYDQKRWLEALRKAKQEVYTWRPRDLQEIANILSRRVP